MLIIEIEVPQNHWQHKITSEQSVTLIMKEVSGIAVFHTHKFIQFSDKFVVERSRFAAESEHSQILD
jgi:hypothetical protein